MIRVTEIFPEAAEAGTSGRILLATLSLDKDMGLGALGLGPCVPSNLCFPDILLWIVLNI